MKAGITQDLVSIICWGLGELEAHNPPEVIIMIGSSGSLNKCIELALKAANTDGNVLLTSENGTGKEQFARAIHDNRRRSGKSFVVVDCMSCRNLL